jgi:hypothetical protein
VKRDPGLDSLLDLDGQVLVIDPEARHWVRFIVRSVPTTAARPHGLYYSLTLHGPNGERLVGFDNAHPVKTRSGPGGKSGPAFDHKHRLKTMRMYKYQDAGALLVDFWTAVEEVLRVRGMIK